MTTVTIASRKSVRRQGRKRRAYDGRSPLRFVLEWYFSRVYGRSEGPTQLPFYCKPERVGEFAVSPAELAVGDGKAVFRLFVALSMYQGLRDVVVMRRQRASSRAMMGVVADLSLLKELIATSNCPAMLETEAFEARCDVSKHGKAVDCVTCPGAPCHVKDATVVFNRMADMGKLPTSAWLRVWRDGDVQRAVAETCQSETVPTKRAQLLVERFAQVHRVGRKLATMFVSALSTPGLAPGLTPWFPDIDGNELVVIDTNVAQAVDKLRESDRLKTYKARECWVREQAASFDLRAFRPELPGYSPRLVQQALYTFCSRSNRLARGDSCADRKAPCAECAPTLCPFVPRWSDSSG